MISGRVLDGDKGGLPCCRNGVRIVDVVGVTCDTDGADDARGLNS